MAPTRDERREVAERLRGLDVEITSHDTLERAVDKFMKAVCGDIPFSPIRYSVRNLCGLANMLADLIDPTCKNTLPHNWGTFECSECGKQFEVNSIFMSASGTDDSEPVIPCFCPNCGARVTGGGEG